MKTRVTILCVLIFNLIEAQPLRTKIWTKLFFYDKKEIIINQINIVSDEKIEFGLIKKDKNYIKKNILMTPNFDYLFIFKKDSMNIKFLYNPYSSSEFEIYEFYFQKGNFIIDLNKCVKEKTFAIKNFPCDCMSYRKEEEEK